MEEEFVDDLKEYSSEVVEFLPTLPPERQFQTVDCATGTDSPLPAKSISTETTASFDAGTQTQFFASSSQVCVDEQKLADWLHKIYPAVEQELLQGPTPLVKESKNYDDDDDEQNIETYQKIAIKTVDNAQPQSALATWLSVQTENAPAFVATTVLPHEDWCLHMDQKLCVYVPRRTRNSSLIIFTEEQRIPLKACLTCLSTNYFNKNIFAGSAFSGDITIWQYEHGMSGKKADVKELFSVMSTHSYTIALDWATEQLLLTCHADGWITQWSVDKEMRKNWDYLIKLPSKASIEITAMICLKSNDFVIGMRDGCIYYCWNSSALNAVHKQIEFTPLKKHQFMVSTLLKTKIDDQVVIISCDLSGQIFYHNLRDNDETTTVEVRLPLPFKNSFACAKAGKMLYFPGKDGSLECYRFRDGSQSSIDGSLSGKGDLIKCSDNGCWIITGLYANEFQIFYVAT